MTQPSLDTLVREIEATPEEYWAEILTQAWERGARAGGEGGVRARD
jgi:hypothetical protein